MRTRFDPERQSSGVLDAQLGKVIVQQISVEARVPKLRPEVARCVVKQRTIAHTAYIA